MLGAALAPNAYVTSAVALIVTLVCNLVVLGAPGLFVRLPDQGHQQMFWSIFFESLVLIVAIIVSGRLVAMLLERRGK